MLRRGERGRTPKEEIIKGQADRSLFASHRHITRVGIGVEQARRILAGRVVRMRTDAFPSHHTHTTPCPKRSHLSPQITLAARTSSGPGRNPSGAVASAVNSVHAGLTRVVKEPPRSTPAAPDLCPSQSRPKLETLPLGGKHLLELDKAECE